MYNINQFLPEVEKKNQRLASEVSCPRRCFNVSNFLIKKLFGYLGKIFFEIGIFVITILAKLFVRMFVVFY
jgi:hypothetical protein